MIKNSRNRLQRELTAPGPFGAQILTTKSSPELCLTSSRFLIREGCGKEVHHADGYPKTVAPHSLLVNSFVLFSSLSGFLRIKPRPEGKIDGLGYLLPSRMQPSPWGFGISSLSLAQASPYITPVCSEVTDSLCDRGPLSS